MRIAVIFLLAGEVQIVLDNKEWFTKDKLVFVISCQCPDNILTIDHKKQTLN